VRREPQASVPTHTLYYTVHTTGLVRCGSILHLEFIWIARESDACVEDFVIIRDSRDVEINKIILSLLLYFNGAIDLMVMRSADKAQLHKGNGHGGLTTPI